MTKRVLVVEDSRTQALRLQLELRRHGLTVELATTGTTGLEEARSKQPDLIVLDVDLPEMDGYTLCRTLKADPLTADIPIVMLTKRDDARDAFAGLEVGAVDYIPKDSFAEQNQIATLRQLGIL